MKDWDWDLIVGALASLALLALSVAAFVLFCLLLASLADSGCP
jgi:hypothetical protein